MRNNPRRYKWKFSGQILYEIVDGRVYAVGPSDILSLTTYTPENIRKLLELGQMVIAESGEK